MTNGALLAAAELSFDVVVTRDKNIRYQQNLTGRRISVLILRARSNNIRDIRPLVEAALLALDSIKSGQVVEVGQSAR